jgi:hypothetical protein
MKWILLGVVSFILVGCIKIAPKNYDTMSYESTLNQPNIGYIEYQSSDLLGQHVTQVSVNINYLGNKGPYDTKYIHVSKALPENGTLRIYIPKVKDAKFDDVDLNIEYGTIRVFGKTINPLPANYNRLNKGSPTTLSDNGNKVTITSELTEPGSYSATMLRSIRK